jgi:hypothetical protein
MENTAATVAFMFLGNRNSLIGELATALVLCRIPLDAKVTYFPFESQLLVWPWTEIFYVSVYVVVALVPLMVPTRHALRWFSSRALLSMLIVFPLYLALPLIAPPRPFVLNGMLGALLNFDRAHDSAAAALPSYHVIWAFLTARVMGRKPWQSRLWQLWAVLVGPAASPQECMP